MRENKSVSAWENSVKSYGATLGVTVTKSQVQKMAKRFHKLDAIKERTEAEMFELFRHITYGDPTGDEAVAHVMDPEACTHHTNAARRMERKAA